MAQGGIHANLHRKWADIDHHMFMSVCGHKPFRGPSSNLQPPYTILGWEMQKSININKICEAEGLLWINSRQMALQKGMPVYSKYI